MSRKRAQRFPPLALLHEAADGHSGRGEASWQRDEKAKLEHRSVPMPDVNSPGVRCFGVER
jgi:hypothetical protein